MELKYFTCVYLFFFISFNFIPFQFILFYSFSSFYSFSFHFLFISFQNLKKIVIMRKTNNQVMIITLLWGFSVLWYLSILLLVCLHVTINLLLSDKSSYQIGKYDFMSFGDHFFLHWVWWGRGVWTVLGRECPRRLCSEMWASLLVSWHILGRQSVLTILSLSFHPYCTAF